MMASENENTNGKPKRMRGWVKAVLILSLAFNLLVIGAVSAKFVAGHKWAKRWGGAVSVLHEGRHFIRSLPRERRREIREIARGHREAFAPVRQAADDARLALAAALEREPFDKQVYAQALEKLKTALRSAADPAGDMLTKVIENLTPGERKAFGRRLKRKPRRRYRSN
jgi:uncharacterized membrane protein